MIHAIRTREANKLATTNITNELAEALMQANMPVVGSGEMPWRMRSTGILQIYNDTGSDLPSASILSIKEPVHTDTSAKGLMEFLNQSTFVGDTPTTDDAGKFCITMEPIPAESSGLAICTGWAICRVNIQAEGDTYADVTDGDSTTLTSAISGAAQILWKEEGMGTKWAVVKMPVGGGGSGIFPVHVVSTNNGFDGSATSYPALTYDVYAFDDLSHQNVLSTGNQVWFQRQLMAKVVTPGRYGMAWRHPGGIYLLWVDEQYQTRACV